MTDHLNDALVHGFEHATLDPETFHHREHLLVAWHYLSALPLEQALERYVRHLRALTEALGVPQKFHATVTWAYVVLLDEAMQASPGRTFDALLAEHPALLDHRTGALSRCYPASQLEQPAARARFQLPRRA